MKKIFGRTLAIAWLAAFGANAASAQAAADDDYSAYFSFLPYYLSVDGARRGTTDDGRGINVGYGRFVSENFSIDLQGFYGTISTSRGNERDFRQYGLGLDVTFWMSDPEAAAPYLVFGGGVVRNDVLPESQSATDAYGNLGIGFISRKLGRSEMRLRAEIRYVLDRYELIEEGFKNDRRIGIGLQIPLGSRTVERVVEREVVRETVVREEVPAAIVDSDNDGVPDQNDRCPGTLAGLATDSVGCASTRPQVVRLDNVNFELNSATLTAVARATLDRVAASLRGEPNLRAEIGGHTDSSGPDAYNQNLSQQRAEAVLRYLVAQGIAPNRLVARGYGESRPVADNATAAGRERNRRVEFTVLN